MITELLTRVGETVIEVTGSPSSAGCCAPAPEHIARRTHTVAATHIFFKRSLPQNP